MSQLLETLARRGEISSLSRYFGEFIADQSDQSMDSLLACTAALVSESSQQGNVCIDLNHYQSMPLFASQWVEIDALPVAPSLGHWRSELLLSPAVGLPGEVSPLILEHDRLYLYRYWHYESQLAESISGRLETVDLPHPQKFKSMLRSLYPDDSYQQQKLAVAVALRRRFALISGGPGTGKTTTVINILRVLIGQQPDLRIVLAAATGKAASRLMESIRQRMDTIEPGDQQRALLPKRALTIHRLLGYGQSGVKFDNQHLLPVDCIIVDEASMVDLTLMYQLLDALPPQARVILLGDRDQLASVAAGSVLADMTGRGLPIIYSRDQSDWLNNVLQIENGDSNIMAGNYPVADSIAFLSESYRFDATGEIGRLADQVNIGNSKAVLDLATQAKQSVFWLKNHSEQLESPILQQILDRYQSVIEATSIERAFEAFESFRVLCAVRNGALGIFEINRRIEQAMRTRGWIASDEQYHGRTILIHSNDYEFDLFNGDVGLLWRASDDRLYACFRDIEQGIRQITINNLPDHGPAWAMTVHKSQGSEFDSVLLILPGHHQRRALSRELLYTGITRARNELSIYANEYALEYACQNPEQRHSGLAKKLGWPASESLPK